MIPVHSIGSFVRETANHVSLSHESSNACSLTASIFDIVVTTVTLSLRGASGCIAGKLQMYMN